MKDSFTYSDGERWTYKKNWFNPRVSKTPSRCWKDQSKRRSQYRRTTHFDLYKPVDYDEVGNVIITDEQLDQLCHLVNTYPALFGV